MTSPNAVKLWVFRLCACCTLFTFFAVLPACNTTEGFGKDVKKAGNAIEDKAQDEKND